MQEVKSRVLSASWVVPVSTEPIPNGSVALEGNRISWVGRTEDLPDVYQSAQHDYFPGVITPGLVNAHTHLQYTSMHAIGKGQYDSFEHWCIPFGEHYDNVEHADTWGESAREGARLMVQTGTTITADIVTDDVARGAIDSVGLGGIEYLEVMGDTVGTWWETGRDSFLDWLKAPSVARVGISPHAPYSLDGDVIRDLVEIAHSRGIRVHTHVAESAQERSLYLSGNGKVVRIAGDLGLDFQLMKQGGSGLGTGDYVNSLGLLGDDSHLAHAIYFNRDERDLILQSGTRVVLCPRSNRVIGLDAPPVADYLNEGHDISIGTDSLSSSPSLDVLEDAAELSSLAQRQGYNSEDLFARLVRALTRGGALALGMGEHGYLQAGAPANLAVFDISASEDVYKEIVLNAAGTCVLAINDGNVIHDRIRQTAGQNC